MRLTVLVGLLCLISCASEKMTDKDIKTYLTVCDQLYPTAGDAARHENCQAQVFALPQAEAAERNASTAAALAVLGAGLQNYGAAMSAPRPQPSSLYCFRAGGTVTCNGN